IGALAEMETVKAHVTDIDAAKRAMHEIAAEGAMHTVVVHFPRGALALSRGAQILFVPSVSVPAELIVGPNGAGDAFAAGFLYGAHEGWHPQESIWLGHAAAACSLRTAGTTDGVESWRECLALAERWGRRTD